MITRVIILCAFFIMGPGACAQQRMRLHLGVIADAHLLDAGIRSYEYQFGNTLQSYKQLATGWSAGLAGVVDLSSKFSSLNSLTFVSDFVRERTSYSGSSHWSHETVTRYSWIELSSSVLYKPVRRQNFSLLTGGGFSSRRLLESTRQHNRGTPHDQTRIMYGWTYLMPLQVGLEFPQGNNQKLLCILELSIALRPLFLPPPPDVLMDSLYGEDYRMHSCRLKVAYILSRKID